MHLLYLGLSHPFTTQTLFVEVRRSHNRLEIRGLIKVFEVGNNLDGSISLFLMDDGMMHCFYVF